MKKALIAADHDQAGGAKLGAGYTVKHIETVAEGNDVRARLYTLAPG